jgi:hypothetical protein
LENMGLVVDELPELGVTRLSRSIVNCYGICTETADDVSPYYAARSAREHERKEEAACGRKGIERPTVFKGFRHERIGE